MSQLLVIDEAAYYADTVKPDSPPTLTQSIARVLIAESPYRAWRRHPRLGNVEREPTAAMERGSLIHCLLTGDTVPSTTRILDYKDFRTKAAQEERDALIAEGFTPMLRKDHDRCIAAAAAARTAIEQQLKQYGVSLDGQFEGSLLWNETADDGTIVPCRCRIDLWNGKTGMILDPKSTENVHPEACRKAIENNGGDIQRAAYTSAIEKCFPDYSGRVGFLNLFIESKEPYEVVPIEHGSLMRRLGDLKWRRAINLWAKCCRLNDWPGYAKHPIAVQASTWAINEEALNNPQALDLLGA